MSEDLIKRSDAIEAIHNYWKKRLETLPTEMSEYGEVYADRNEVDKFLEHNKTLCSFIKDIPTIEPKRGKWIDKGWHGDWQFETDGRGNCWHEYECSECGLHSKGSKSNFCSHCGANMRGKDDE